LSAKLKNAFDRRGDVLVEPIGKLDDHDRALARRPQQAPDDRSTRVAAYFTEDDFHDPKLA